MKKKKTLINVIIILAIVSFFVTPIGHYGKVILNQLLAPSPKINEQDNRDKISDYNWKLKDEAWNFFNFDKSQGKVVFVNFWASWRLPSEAELKSINALYETYGHDVDFYIITNEEREPVEEFMEKKDFSFPVTYLIIGEKAPFELPEPPATYIISKSGEIVIAQEGIADWDTPKIRELLDHLLKE